MRRLLTVLLNWLGRRRRNITLPPPPTDAAQDSFNTPPGFTPIESSYDFQPISGTSLLIGRGSRVGQTSNGELVTCDQTKGVRGRCGHDIFVIDEIVTEQSIHRGIGGRCAFCTAEAAEMLRLNLITRQQAEELSLYCTQCASRCDGCRRTDICRRHAQEFEDADGKIMLLCPACIKKAELEKFFKKTMTLMLAPFADNKHKPPTE